MALRHTSTGAIDAIIRIQRLTSQISADIAEIEAMTIRHQQYALGTQIRLGILAAKCRIAANRVCVETGVTYEET